MDEVVERHGGSGWVHQDRIEMVRVPCSRRRLRREEQRQPAEFLVVTCPYFLAPLPVPRDPAKLMKADCSLDVHHVVFVAALDDVVVRVAGFAEAPPGILAHAMEREYLQAICEFLVRRQDHSAFTGRDILGDVKTE